MEDPPEDVLLVVSAERCADFREGLEDCHVTGIRRAMQTGPILPDGLAESVLVDWQRYDRDGLGEIGVRRRPGQEMQLFRASGFRAVKPGALPFADAEEAGLECV